MSLIDSSPVGILIRGPTPHCSTGNKVARAVAFLVSFGVIAAGSLNVVYNRDVSAQSGPAGLLLTMSSVTIIILPAFHLLELLAPRFFFRLGIFTSYALVSVLWLIAWTWSVSVGNRFLRDVCFIDADGAMECSAPSAEEKKYGSSLVGGASAGALVWVLMTYIAISFYRQCTHDPRAVEIEIQNLQQEADAERRKEQAGY